LAGAGYLSSFARTRPRRAVAPATLIALLGGCGSHSPAPAPHPAQVGVVVAHSQSVPLTRELVGRLSATRAADVRARVAGVLLKRLYKEGSDVRQGQALFQIDPAPLRAALDGAEAALAQAQANATNAHVAAQRARELITSGLVSRSDLDNAEATERSTAASVQQAKAGVGTARINLSYATVTAPIAGRGGQQGVTEGALVGQGTATLLTTGKVLVAGGVVGSAVATAELYDTATGMFTRTISDMTVSRSGHTATLLNDPALPNYGKVLLVGGSANLAAAPELYDPATETFTATGPLAAPRQNPTSTLLLSGKVLIVGGNIRGYTRTMTTAIALETSKGDLALALGLGLILILLSVLVSAAAFLRIAMPRMTETGIWSSPIEK